MNTKLIAILQRFLREPLLHFIAIGGLFFLLYSSVNDPGEKSVDTIVISPVRINQIETGFKGVWNRMPTSEELDNLIEEEVRSEVYYRDALALGLDKNDAIVRRRLRQKMEFLTDTGIYLQKPSENELVTYYAANKNIYRRQPRLAFEQIYLGQSPSGLTVSHTLQALLTEPSGDLGTLGQPTRLPAQLKLSLPGTIDSVYGKGFYNQISTLTPGEWDGPVTSVYGTHLIRTLDGKQGYMPLLEEIRDLVVKDWRAAKAKENREQDYAMRRGHYIIEIIRRDNAGLAVNTEIR